MTKVHKLSKNCGGCDAEALQARITQLENEVMKLVSLVDGQKEDIDSLKSRIATIKLLAMDGVGTRKVK